MDAITSEHSRSYIIKVVFMFLFSHTFKRNDYIYMLVLAILTTLASEIKLVPFSGEAIRFGLGSIAFFLLVLIRPPQSLIRAGFIAGGMVVCFRLLLDITVNHTEFIQSLMSHLPAGLFYFLFAVGLQIINIEKYKQSPLLLGAFATGMEFISNSAEHLFRLLIIDGFNVSLGQWGMLAMAAFIRSYVVIGLYSSITISEQKKQITDMLGIGN